MRVESILIGSIGFIIGAAIGGVFGYFVSESKFKKRGETEWAQYREYLRKKKKEEEAVKAESASNDISKEEKKKETPSTKDFETYRDKSSVYADPQQRKEEVVNYSGYSVKPKPEKEPEDLSPKEMEGIYKITEDQYNNEYVERYGKERLTYYLEGHELYDEDDNAMDIGRVCGYEMLSKWPEGNHLFIRNVPQGVDYDIEFKDEAFYHWE